MDMNKGPGSSYMLAANEKIGQMKQQGQSPEQIHTSMLEAVKSGLLPFTVAVQALKQYSDPMQVPPQFPKQGSVVADLLAANMQRDTGVAAMPNPVMDNAQMAGGITGQPAPAMPTQGMAHGGIVAFGEGDSVLADPYGVYADSPVYKYFKPSIDTAQQEVNVLGNPSTYKKKAEDEVEADFTKYGIGQFGDRERRIDEREARLAAQEKNAGLDAFIKGAFGMAAAGARPGATFLGAAAEGAGQGFEAYGAGKDKIEAAKQAVADARDRLADAQQAVRLGKMSASSKAFERLQGRYDAAKANLRTAQGKAGESAADYAKAQLSADAQLKAARLYAGQKNRNEDAFAPQIDAARQNLIAMRQRYPANDPRVVAAEERLQYWNSQRQDAMTSSNPTAYGGKTRADVALTKAETADPVIQRAFANVTELNNRILNEKGKASPALYQALAQAQATLAQAREAYARGRSGIAGPPAVEEVQGVPKPAEGTVVRDATDSDFGGG